MTIGHDGHIMMGCGEGSTELWYGHHL